MRSTAKLKDNITAYAFLAPSFAGFLLFTLFPVLFSLFISFFSWDIVGGLGNLKFIGLENFINLFKDDYFIHSLNNNILYSVVFVPVTIIISLLIAVALNTELIGREIIRGMFFLPFVLNIVAVSVIWVAFYRPDVGPINMIIKAFGVANPPQWLASPDTVMLAITITNIWLNIGYVMVILLAGLQSIPKHLYEAAVIDGADRLKQFFSVTLPMLSPTTFFVLITTIINSFKVFGTVNVMTQGGPGDSSSVIVFDIYVTAFRYYKMGYASAMAWILFIMVFAITLIQWRGQKKWVNYSV